MFTGIVSLCHSDSLSFCRNEALVFNRPSAKFRYQMNVKMGSHFRFSQVLGASHHVSGPYHRHINSATARGNRYQGFSSNDEFDKPFWLKFINDITLSLRSLALFLVEQPSQLKYIEWPTIKSTAKTATLTLVLVALLMVSLATVDSLLCYILVLLSRKSA